MIISKTPFRISFFGGGTDFEEYFKENGGSVISTTIDKYCYVTARYLPPFFDYTTEVSYSKIERVSNINNIEHPLIKAALKYTDIKDVRLTYEADLPARSGLGSSSSFAVGMLNALYKLKGMQTDKRKLANDAIFIERNICNETGGWQDQIAASFGGFNKIVFTDKGYTVYPLLNESQRLYLNQNIMMFFTGFTRLSSIVLKENNITNKNKHGQIKEIQMLTEEAQKILEGNVSGYNEIGKLLDYTWQIKKSLGETITNNETEEIYKRAIKAGAIGGKIIGAGGGGFIIFYVPLDAQENVKRTLKDLLYVPIKFENKGTQIISNL